MPGYAELFRRYADERYQDEKKDIDFLGLLTRLTAEVYKGSSGKKILFTLPGASGATVLGISEIITPGLPFLYTSMNKKDDVRD